MYARNNATPEKIAIGPVVQISDGAVQTTGCTVRIIPDGVAEGDGAGTTAYSTDGVVIYTPTQAETDYTSFLLIAKKTGCIPASVTIVTTASATNGNVVLSPETHTSAVIPTVTTLTGHTAQTADHTAGIAAIPTTAMRGTDNAALASVATEARLAELDAGNLPTDIAAIPTTAMRGTDNAALASVATEARLAELDAANLPTDIAAIPTTAMRGTDNAATSTEMAAAKENIDYALTVLVGALSTAGTAGEVYTFTVDGVAYTVTYAGLDSSGNRGTTVLSKV